MYNLDILLFLCGTSRSMSCSNCCFLTCIEASQEAGQLLWYSHLFQNFPMFIVIHTVNIFEIVNKAEADFFFWNSFVYWWSSWCWPFDLWFLWLFKNQLEHLEVYGSCIDEAWLGEFLALLYLRVRGVQLCSSLSILWHCLSLGLEWKLTFSSPKQILSFSNLLTYWVQHFHSIII